MPELTKIILACDESGAKGYGDRDEAFDGEVGVFAGIMIPEECVEVCLPDFQSICDRYVPDTGKFHIADLPAAQQVRLREDVYAAIGKHRLPCFWYAVHVAGFHDSYTSRKAGVEEIIREHRALAGEPRVKRGSPRDNPPSLHVALFSGLYAHVVAFLAERGRTMVDIEVRSDQIDKPVMEEFRAEALRLLSDDPLVKQGTGFDTVEKKVVHGEIRVEVKLPADLDLDIVVQRLTIRPLGIPDPFVIAADVLANSLNHHFSRRDEGERYGPLNTPEAVAGHPLGRHLDAFEQWAPDPLGDAIWAHPKAR